MIVVMLLNGWPLRSLQGIAALLKHCPKLLDIASGLAESLHFRELLLGALRLWHSRSQLVEALIHLKFEHRAGRKGEAARRATDLVDSLPLALVPAQLLRNVLGGWLSGHGGVDSNGTMTFAGRPHGVGPAAGAGRSGHSSAKTNIPQ